jgi:hypothetical protein
MAVFRAFFFPWHNRMRKNGKIGCNFFKNADKKVKVKKYCRPVVEGVGYERV